MPDIRQLLQGLSASQFGFNVLDAIILLVVLFYAYEGYALGFVYALMDLGSFIVSFILALKFYGVVAKLLIDVFSMPIGFANALGFFILALLSEIILNILFRRLVVLLPSLPEDNRITQTFRNLDHLLGIVPGMLSAFIILSFLFSVIVSLPSSPFLKNTVTSSKIGSQLVAHTETFEKRLNDIFGGALNETLNFLTIEPQSEETVNLHFKVKDGSVDPIAEQEMLRLVNKERVANGVDPLVSNNKLRSLARSYSDDMFQRGYFSHYNPEGQSPFDRMTADGITFNYAGENLALAPSTQLAMQGLMNSPGHRANILNPHFRKVGIGVIDGGIYGKMYTQEFTD